MEEHTLFMMTARTASLPTLRSWSLVWQLGRVRRAHHVRHAARGPPPMPPPLVPGCSAAGAAGAAAAFAVVTCLAETRCLCVLVPSRPRFKGCRAVCRRRCLCCNLPELGHAAMNDGDAPRQVGREGVPRRCAARATGAWSIVARPSIPWTAGVDHMHAELVDCLMPTMMLCLLQEAEAVSRKRSTSYTATLSEQACFCDRYDSLIRAAADNKRRDSSTRASPADHKMQGMRHRQNPLLQLSMHGVAPT